MILGSWIEATFTPSEFIFLVPAAVVMPQRDCLSETPSENFMQFHLAQPAIKQHQAPPPATLPIFYLLWHHHDRISSYPQHERLLVQWPAILSRGRLLPCPKRTAKRGAAETIDGVRTTEDLAGTVRVTAAVSPELFKVSVTVPAPRRFALFGVLLKFL